MLAFIVYLKIINIKLKDKILKIMWYIKYFWIKLNIWVLTPLVKIEQMYKAYQQARLEVYVKYMCMSNNIKT